MAENEVKSVPELTDKQRLFVEAYLICWNATEAARKAGYSAKAARQQGAENLSKPYIRAFIDARLKEVCMSADEVLARLTQQASANINDFVYFGSNGHIRGLKKKALRERGHLVKKITSSEGKTESIGIELYDAQAALALIGKHHKLFTEIQEHTGKDGGPIEVKEVGLTDAERAARIAAIFDAAREKRAGQPPTTTGAEG